MARIFFSLLLLHLITNSFGQESNRFKNFHGLRQPESSTVFFEAEGYDILIWSLDFGLTEKNLKKVKKKLSAKKSVLSFDSALNLSVLKQIPSEPIAQYYRTLYLIPVSSDQIKIIDFTIAQTPDLDLERMFVTSFITDQIPDFVYTNIEIDTVDFVGRDLVLGPACRWMSPHNIQCPNLGQMNWAIFDDYNRALQYRDDHLEYTIKRNMVNLINKEEIELYFEGKKTVALRAKIKVKVPQLVMGGSNVLIVYYVTENIRGKYVSCVLSHYTDDINADSLPPLLGEVLSFTE